MEAISHSAAGLRAQLAAAPSSDQEAGTRDRRVVESHRAGPVAEVGDRQDLSRVGHTVQGGP